MSLAAGPASAGDSWLHYLETRSAQLGRGSNHLEGESKSFRTGAGQAPYSNGYGAHFVNGANPGKFRFRQTNHVIDDGELMHRQLSGTKGQL